MINKQLTESPLKGKSPSPWHCVFAIDLDIAGCYLKISLHGSLVPMGTRLEEESGTLGEGKAEEKSQVARPMEEKIESPLAIGEYKVTETQGEREIRVAMEMEAVGDGKELTF